MKRSNRRRGFSLLVVALVMALLSIGAAALLDLIKLDLMLSKNDRSEEEAREVAEGALMESINDVRTPTLLPGLDDTDLESTYSALSSSPFYQTSGGRKFDAKYRLLRLAPLNESSYSQSRAIVYEVEIQASASNGDSSSELRTQIFKTVSLSPGIILPARHAR